MQRQYERCVEDKYLKFVLRWLKNSEYKKEILVVEPNIFSLPNLSLSTNEYLVVVIKSNVLITCYWCKYLSCIVRNTNGVRYQLLEFDENKNSNSKLKLRTLSKFKNKYRD